MAKGKYLKKKRRPRLLMPLLALALILGGGAVFLYPTLSNLYAARHHATVIQNYAQALDSVDSEQLRQAWEEARTYNENLMGDPVHDPFIPGSGYVLPDNYQQVLNLDGDGVMGYIQIPSISVRLPIYHGTGEDVLENGVGHIEQTALPIGGTGTHAVLTGHRGLATAELFTRLDELELGDRFYIHVLDETLAYEVTQITTVLPYELEELAAVQGEDLVTLVTCTPYGVNTHRLLVQGSRVEFTPEELPAGVSQVTFALPELEPAPLLTGIGIGVLILLVLLIPLLRRRHTKGKRRSAR